MNNRYKHVFQRVKSTHIRIYSNDLTVAYALLASFQNFKNY